MFRALAAKDLFAAGDERSRHLLDQAGSLGFGQSGPSGPRLVLE